jgi:hypothetical protein
MKKERPFLILRLVRILTLPIKSPVLDDFDMLLGVVVTKKLSTSLSRVVLALSSITIDLTILVQLFRKNYSANLI